MDLQGVASAIMAPAARLFLGNGETVLLVLVAMVVLRVELLGRIGDWGPAREAGGFAQVIKRFVKQCAPEAAALVATLTLAAALRARGGNMYEGDATWAEIKDAWPVLMGADTLLSLQAMLRLTVVVSVVLRGSGAPTPLSGEPTALWLCGAAARAALLTQTSAYALDGPLGGSIPAAFEVAVLVVLLGMSRGVLGRISWLSALLAVAGTAAFSYRNRLTLAEEPVSDSLFIFAHCSEVLAALAYLLRTAMMIGGPDSANVSVGFTHALMPVQASLSAYYFVQGFPPVQELVAEGSPFEVLQAANAAALGAYLGAAALYIAA